MSDEKILKSFQFHMPVDITKSDEEDQWYIQGIASTDDEDLQGEIVDQGGLDISLLKAGRGLFNHDHQKGPENILGQIEDASFVDVDGKKALFVKGYLFKAQDRAKAYYNIMKSIKKGSTHRVHFSIEGKILQRDMSNPSKIQKARIDKVALTLDPVNPVTYATFAKSLAADIDTNGGVVSTIDENTGETVVISKELLDKVLEVNKALMAGAGYGKAPEVRADGEAMGKEALDKKVKTVTYDKKRKKKKITKSMIKLAVDRIKEKNPEISRNELIEVVTKCLGTIKE